MNPKYILAAVLGVSVSVAGSDLRGTPDENTDATPGPEIRAKPKYDYSGYSYVHDFEFYGESFLTMRQKGVYYKCKKGCIDSKSDKHCDGCFIDYYDDVYCEGSKGKLPDTCVDRCCDEIGDGGDDEPVQTSDPYEEMTYVQDYNKFGDEDTLKMKYGSDFYECSKKCIDRKSHSKCSSCVVTDYLDVYCEDGELDRSCRYSCCDEVEPDEPDPYGDFTYVLDYSDWTNDKNILTIKDDRDYYKCSKRCIDKKSSGKCRSCMVDDDREVYCEDGEVSKMCRNKCCSEVSYLRAEDQE